MADDPITLLYTIGAVHLGYSSAKELTAQAEKLLSHIFMRLKKHLQPAEASQLVQ